jgi:glutamate-ammonia-ligase adenylyltransferase
MRELVWLRRLSGLPRPFDAKRAKEWRAEWRALAEREPEHADFVKGLARLAKGRKLLDAIFGNSPYLCQLALREPAIVRGFLTTGPEQSMADILDFVDHSASLAKNADALMQPLRVAKRRAALLVALADLSGLWPLERVTAALSDLADRALQAGLDRLLDDAAERGDFSNFDRQRPGRNSGLVLLGLGKLGGRELNYSSDIDLMAFWDQDKAIAGGGRNPQDAFVSLVRDLVRLMQERTGDGYVFRTDLRLRPDPSATPLALSMAAAENYYESLGQNWERAALIKARVVAGDVAAGNAFLDRLAPFIWRKHLDFAAIEDIHSIKRQIHAAKGHETIKIAGHDIKLGRGGIREIEFFAQTQQLIAGGRDPSLRVRSTCAAIRRLAKTGRLTSAVADDLIDAYRQLRRIEHRLQMIDDTQTHTLPLDEGDLARVAMFSHFAGRQEFAGALEAILRRVQGHYTRLFEKAPPLSGIGSLVFTGVEDDPETLATLAELGYREPARLAARVRLWHHGRFPAMRSERAREKLTAIMPKLLEALAATVDPDAAFARFDEFLARLPAGIQLFSLFYANPGLLDITAEIMGTAPRLAEYLSHRPASFDGMLSGDFFAPLASARALTEALRQELERAKDYQDVLDISRRWLNERKLQIGLQTLRHLADANRAGVAFAEVAEAVLRALLPWVEQDFAQRRGRVVGGAMAIIGMGRLGGREMTLESDLDLIFVYTHHREAEMSDGPSPLPATQYFARLSQRMIGALSALTGEGRLFEVDMRLRPSGHAGPIAVSVEAFDRYQREQAWTWEHLALTRARVVAGPEPLGAKIERIIGEVLRQPRDAAQIAADVADMRRTIAKEHGTDNSWAVKHVRGGLIDIEFICQYLQLRHAHKAPGVLAPRTIDALENLAKAGVLKRSAADDLIAAASLFAGVLAMTRLCQRETFAPETAAPGLKNALARMANVGRFEDLAQKLLDGQAQVRRYFHELIEAEAPTGRTV